MGGVRKKRRFSWRLSIWGWILAVALVVLIILAIVSPTTPVFIGLVAVIVIWAGMLSASFPSTKSMYNHTLHTAETGAEDFGAEAIERRSYHK